MDNAINVSSPKAETQLSTLLRAGQRESDDEVEDC